LSSGFRVSGPGFWSRGSGSGYLASGFGSRTSSFWFRVVVFSIPQRTSPPAGGGGQTAIHGSHFEFSSFVLRVSRSKFSGFGFRVSGSFRFSGSFQVSTSELVGYQCAWLPRGGDRDQPGRVSRAVLQLHVRACVRQHLQISECIVAEWATLCLK